MQEDFARLYEENPDVIGWLTAGETIDLPVVQRDNEYYLSHNYFGEWDSNGTVYRSYRYPRITGSVSGDRPVRTYGWIELDGIENAPEWVDITHLAAGWTIRVQLPGGEEAAP